MTQHTGSFASRRRTRTLQPHRLASRRPDRSRDFASLQLRRAQLCQGMPAIRLPRRSSPTACASSAARSNITVRAAFSPPDRTSPTLWSNCATEPARAEHARHDGRAVRRPCRREPESLAVACLRRDGGQRLCCRPFSRPASTTRPSCGRRLSGRRSTSRRSAAPPALDVLRRCRRS